MVQWAARAKDYDKERPQKKRRGKMNYVVNLGGIAGQKWIRGWSPSADVEGWLLQVSGCARVAATATGPPGCDATRARGGGRLTPLSSRKCGSKNVSHQVLRLSRRRVPAGAAPQHPRGASPFDSTRPRINSSSSSSSSSSSNGSGSSRRSSTRSSKGNHSRGSSNKRSSNIGRPMALEKFIRQRKCLRTQLEGRSVRQSIFRLKGNSPVQKCRAKLCCREWSVKKRA